MKLSELLKDVEYKIICGDTDREVSSVEYDSRKVKEGSLFIANKGFGSDGHSFIGKALDQGACAIVVDELRENYPSEELFSLKGDRDVTIISIANTRLAMADLSAAFYGHPEKNIDIVGLTGTKGKTTTTFMIHNVMRKAGIESGLMGTVCSMILDEKKEAMHTTPEAHEIYEFMSEVQKHNVKNLVMEVSSQGLKLDRVYGLKFKVGCFTNLYEDHIGGNEHTDMEDYIKCKLKIFENTEIALINGETDQAERVISYAKERCKVLTYGIGEGFDIKALNIRKETRDGVNGSVFTLVSPWYEGEVYVDLPGKFSIYNALCAIGVSGIMNLPFEAVKEGLNDIRVPGRVQLVKNKLGLTILVDYAHNRDSLVNVLETMREYTTGQLICLFGCGGNRSRERRFLMGEVSGQLADMTVVTSDNPRNENPLDIIADIVGSLDKTGGKYEVEPDRTAGIEKAIRLAKPGDTVIIAGKGHEDYQEFENGRKIHFDDFEVATEIVKKIEGEA